MNCELGRFRHEVERDKFILGIIDPSANTRPSLLMKSELTFQKAF